jgi:uncharacterized protein with PQ loop repeat
MYCIYIVACFLFLIGGILLLIENNVSAGLPLVVAQSICGINSMIIFIWKLKNYFIAKKANISEFEY